MIRQIEFPEWLRRVNQMLNFCIDRTAESFGGIFWEELYEKGYRPLEVAVAFIEEYQAAVRFDV